MKANLICTFSWLCGVVMGIFLTLASMKHHNANHTSESTNAPNYQIVRFSPSEIEVRDVNIPPPGYGVATNELGGYKTVCPGGYFSALSFTSRKETLDYAWALFDIGENDRLFHVSEPPK